MRKGDYKWGKFICPTCGKKFRSKIDPTKDIIIEKVQLDPMFGGGFETVEFECHTHCPVCEEPIPWRDRRK